MYLQDVLYVSMPVLQFLTIFLVLKNYVTIMDIWINQAIIQNFQKWLIDKEANSTVFSHNFRDFCYNIINTDDL